MKSIRLLILVLCCSSSAVMAMQYQSKEDPWLHTQPNGTTTFMAVTWDHSFMKEYETDDGYTIVQSTEDSYWYYAELDDKGEYTPSDAIVGIDDPPGAPHLRRSPNRIAQIEDDLVDLREDQETFADRWRGWFAQHDEQNPLELNVAVLLVEFTEHDRRGKKGVDPELENESYITRDYLLNMVTRPGIYNWGAEGGVNETLDGYHTCGNIYDYWDDISNGQIQMIAADLPEGDLLINADDPENNNKPIWLDMDAEMPEGDGWFSPFLSARDWYYENFMDLCVEKDWLPEPNPNPPIYPGFDILIVVYAGNYAWMVGEEMDFEEMEFEGYEGRDIPGDGNAGILRATICETWYGNDFEHGNHLLQVGAIIDEVLDPLAFDLYPDGGGDGDEYGFYPRGADERNNVWCGGIVGGFDNASRQTGEMCMIQRPDWLERRLGDQPVGNSCSYWNPRDRIKMGWFGNHIELEQDIAAFHIELASIDESESQPTFCSYKYVDSYDDQTPIYGQFFLECRRVLTGVEEEIEYKDFNSLGVGSVKWDDSHFNENWRRKGYVPTQNKNNLLIWHAEDEGKEIHVQFGDGHAYCSNFNFDVMQDPDRRPPGWDWEAIDGHIDLNGNDYFPSPGDGWHLEQDQTEFGPGTFQNRAIEALDYSSVDLLRSHSDLDYDIMQTGFCVKNIVSNPPDDESSGNITCDVYTNYWGGETNEDLNLSGGNLYLGQNCEIVDDATVTIEAPTSPTVLTLDSDVIISSADATLFIDANHHRIDVLLNGFDIIIEAGTLYIGLVPRPPRPKLPQIEQGIYIHGPGRIIHRGGGDFTVVGFTDQPVIFTSAEAIPAPGDWEGILIEDATGDISMEYADIRYAVTGIKSVDCTGSVSFDHVNITDFSSTGINLVDSSPTIDSCSASNSTPQGSSQPVGLYCYDSSPNVTYSDFDNNYRGVEAYGTSSVVEMGYCSMSDNDQDGVYLYDAVAYMYNSSGYPNNGYNLIIDNGGGAGVYAGGTASPYLGYGSSSQGYNSIYDNTSYDVANYTTSEVQAEYNWWNDILGPSNNYGSVDSSPWLYSSPGGGPAPRKPDGGNGGNQFIAGADDEEDDAFRFADSLFARGNLGGALQAYSGIISDYPDNPRIFNVIRRLRNCYRGLDRGEDWGNLLAGLRNNGGLHGQARRHLTGIAAHDLARDGNADQAVTLITNTLQNLDEEADAYPSLLFQKGMIQHYTQGDPEGATATFVRFMRLFEDHPMFKAAQLEHASSVSDAENADSPYIPGEIDKPEVVTEFALYKPYPNPFNESVTIKYAVPDVAYVRLVLYDVTGRQVEIIIEKVHQPGFHQVQVFGTSLDSGVYLCRMQSENFDQTVRLIYLK